MCAVPSMLCFLPTPQSRRRSGGLLLAMSTLVGSHTSRSSAAGTWSSHAALSPVASPRGRNDTPHCLSFFTPPKRFSPFSGGDLNILLFQKPSVLINSQAPVSWSSGTPAHTQMAISKPSGTGRAWWPGPPPREQQKNWQSSTAGPSSWESQPVLTSWRPLLPEEGGGLCDRGSESSDFMGLCNPSLRGMRCSAHGGVGSGGELRKSLRCV
uniref:Uncharacterized protein n=1 Tax=Pipistrellus kuhlii TaxID=59472 RepID=A0A7J7TPN2_PIPKU|nr:hypothetical protein mPipKuh1_009322 [Pipistrellus kuhlii]